MYDINKQNNIHSHTQPLIYFSVFTVTCLAFLVALTTVMLFSCFSCFLLGLSLSIKFIVFPSSSPVQHKVVEVMVVKGRGSLGKQCYVWHFLLRFLSSEYTKLCCLWVCFLFDGLKSGRKAEAVLRYTVIFCLCSVGSSKVKGKLCVWQFWSDPAWMLGNGWKYELIYFQRAQGIWLRYKVINEWHSNAEGGQSDIDEPHGSSVFSSWC